MDVLQTKELAFWSKVDRNPEDCWRWIASVDSSGYGQFHIRPKMYRAHRVAYLLAIGEIPQYGVISQTCKNIICVRPSHLELLTRAEVRLRGKDLTLQSKNNTIPKRVKVKSILSLEQKQRINRSNWLQNKYNITIEQFEQSCELQNYQCGICGHSIKENSLGEDKKLVVDHDHFTGKVRGLLCDRCNLGIGCLSDDIARLRKAIEYLETPPWPF